MSWRLGVLLALVLGVGGFQFFYPPLVHRRAVNAALEKLEEVVATQQREKIVQALGELLDAAAPISLEVEFLSLTEKGRQPVKQEFNKESFLKFVDNLLYSTEQYRFDTDLLEFAIQEGVGRAYLYANTAARGKSYYGGVSVMMQFSAGTACGVDMTLDDAPRLVKLECKVKMRAVPVQEDMHKLQSSPEAMQQFLMR